MPLKTSPSIKISFKESPLTELLGVSSENLTDYAICNLVVVLQREVKVKKRKKASSKKKTIDYERFL